MSDLRWTDEMVEMLRSQRAAGRSFGYVAAMLNQAFPAVPVSRNAVIGKANRIGLPRGVMPKKTPKPVRPPARAKGAKGGAAPAPVAPPKLIAPDLSNAIAPESGITFLEIRDGVCRWPISEETSFDLYRACGCPCDVVERYCTEHKVKARDVRRTRESSQRSADKAQEHSRRNINSLFFMRTSEIVR